MNGCEYVLSFDSVNGAVYCGAPRLVGFLCLGHTETLEQLVTIAE